MPATPAMPRISPARTSKLMPLTRGTPWSPATTRSRTSSTGSRGRAGAFSTRSSTLRPTISSASSSLLVSAVLRCATIGPGAHDADLVGHRHDLAQLVGDQDDGAALRLEVAQDAEEMVGLLRRQHAGGLVEDQDVRAAEERLEDLDPLLHADRQARHRRVEVDLEAVVALERRDLGRARSAPVGQGEAALGAEQQVLEHGERLDQHEVLVDHADAGLDRVLRALDRRGLAVDQDLAAVGLVEAVEDVHQGRLAGAVLADDAVDRAGRDDQVDVAVGVDEAEALVDPAQLDRRGQRPRQRRDAAAPAAHCS